MSPDKPTPDKPLKSSLELAMERLRKADAAAGIEARPLTESEKAAIAEVRNFYEAKLAEQDVLHHSRLRRVVDLAERDTLEDEYRRERERLASERDAKIEKLRRG
jgi:primosomal protein N''